MKKYLALFLAAVVMLSPLASVEAKTTSDLQKMLDQLQLQIKQLQSSAALTSAQTTDNPNLEITSFDDNKDGKPKIKITTPTAKKKKFNKSDPADPILISWTAYNVPEDTNLIIDLNTVKIKGPLGGGSAQFELPEGDSKGTYKWDIYGEGMASAGTYRVQLGLEECSSLGCDINAHFPGQEEEVELYTQSRSVGVKVIVKSVKSSSTEKTDLTNKSNSVAIIETNKGIIEMELFEDTMPITTGNFIKLANNGFYDQTKFHRVIAGFMIQGGDPKTKEKDTTKYGTGGPGYTIPDEFVKGIYLSNMRGSLAMANSGPNTGGSQFYINLVDNKTLDWNVPDPNNSNHPVFGRVISGMDIIDSISEVKTNSRNIPQEAIIVKKVEIK